MTNNQPLRDQILLKIKGQEIAIKPRMYFTLRVALLGILTAIMLSATVLIFNYILFVLRLNAHTALLGFGEVGFLRFLKFFPWYLLALNIGCIAILEVLIRSFRFGYRAPILYGIALLIAIAGAVGTTLDRATPLNDRLLERAERRELPQPLNIMYVRARREPPPDSFFCKCTVVSVDGPKLVLSDMRSASTTFVVIVPPNSAYATTSKLEVGDMVIIAGDRAGDEIRIFGVKQELPKR